MLNLVINATASSQDIWNCYFKEFITYKLKLQAKLAPKEDIVQLMLCTYFESLDASNQLVKLHCFVNMKQLLLAQMSKPFHELSNIQRVS